MSHINTPQLIPILILFETNDPSIHSKEFAFGDDTYIFFTIVNFENVEVQYVRTEIEI